MYPSFASERDKFTSLYSHKDIHSVIDNVKVQHRPAYRLDEWQMYNYHEVFPKIRPTQIKWLETLDMMTSGCPHPQSTTLDDDNITTLNTDNSNSTIDPSNINSIPSNNSILHIIRSIERKEHDTFTVDEFRQNYEIPSKPVMIANTTQGWNMAGWTPLSVYNNPKYTHSRFRIGDDDDGRAMRAKYSLYLQYMYNTKDDSPLYLFEDAFDEHPDTIELVNDYIVPKYFQQDLFPMLPPDRRPPFRWIIIGPCRSGTKLHIDPLSTSAWNTLLSGRKRWFMCSPNVPKDIANGRVVMTPEELAAGRMPEAIHWFSSILPRLRRYIASLPREVAESYHFMECIQYPNETIYVPGGWWHAVMNLDDTVAVTQNWVNHTNLSLVWDTMMNRRPYLARIMFDRMMLFEPKLMTQVVKNALLDGTYNKSNNIHNIDINNDTIDTIITNTKQVEELLFGHLVPRRHCDWDAIKREEDSTGKHVSVYIPQERDTVELSYYTARKAALDQIRTIYGGQYSTLSDDDPFIINAIQLFMQCNDDSSDDGECDDDTTSYDDDDKEEEEEEESDNNNHTTTIQ